MQKSLMACDPERVGITTSGTIGVDVKVVTVTEDILVPVVKAMAYHKLLI